MVPQIREKVIWRELTRRLDQAAITTVEREPSAGVAFSVETGSGPILALTSWARLLDFLEVATTHHEAARSDVRQLRALCVQADENALVPFAPDWTTNKGTPWRILQLTTTVQDALALVFNEGSLHRGRLTPQADWRRIGRYVNVLEDARVGIWFGLHFDLWKRHEVSPLWAVFSTSDWGRASEVRALLEPWAAKRGLHLALEPDGSLGVAFPIPVGEEKEAVIRPIVDQFREIAQLLSVLPPRETEQTLPEVKDSEEKEVAKSAD